MRGQSIFCEKLKIEIVYRFHQIIAKFDEIGTFQFLTDFTKNALVPHIVKAQKCDAHIQKADKICDFRSTKLIMVGEILETM